MTDTENPENLLEIENKIRAKYSRLSKGILFIGIILILWAGIVFAGILFWGYAYNWAFFNMDIWLLIVSILLAILIISILAINLRFSVFIDKKELFEPGKPEFIGGKKIHVFTHPKGIEGGIFSKTLIEIDDHNVLRLRSLMIAPGELWSPKKEEKTE